MKTEKQLILMEYNPEQGWYHYNRIDKDSGVTDKAPCTFGWEPVAIIDEDTAYDNRFCDMTHAILRKNLDVEFVKDVTRTAVKCTGHEAYGNAIFMGRFLVKLETNQSIL